MPTSSREREHLATCVRCKTLHRLQEKGMQVLVSIVENYAMKGTGVRCLQLVMQFVERLSNLLILYNYICLGIERVGNIWGLLWQRFWNCSHLQVNCQY